MAYLSASSQGKSLLHQAILRKIFVDIRFSERGSNAREVEEKTYMLFLDYLEECEQAQSSDGVADYQCQDETDQSAITLPMVLSFSTGAEEVPPLGFPHDPVLGFSDSLYPTAATCAIQLTLPTRYTDYSAFKAALDLAFLSHGGFGLS